jgi:adenylate kinase
MGLPHVSSGDLFREHIRSETSLGRQADEYISRGELVPDQVTIEMVRERLQAEDAARGAVLDGFPRTVAQAEALEQMADELGGSVRATVHIRVPEERLIERMAGRRVCSESSHVYHLVHNPPKQEGICDIDGSTLYQREDDEPETVRHRVRVYERQTEPLIEFYRDREVLLEVNGDQPIEPVTDEILAVLERTA